MKRECIGDRIDEGRNGPDRNGYGIGFRCLRGKIGHLYRTLTPIPESNKGTCKMARCPPTPPFPHLPSPLIPAAHHHSFPPNLQSTHSTNARYGAGIAGRRCCDLGWGQTEPGFRANSLVEADLGIGFFSWNFSDFLGGKRSREGERVGVLSVVLEER